MSPDRERRRDEIVEEALGVYGAAREVLLERACGGDGELRGAVERLLDLTERMSRSFLEQGAPVYVMPRLERGQKVDRYEIRERVGSGGMSIVYRAHDTQIDRPVALKIMLSQAGDEKAGYRFLAELRSLGKIRHEHVVSVYDFGEFEGLPFLVMEFLDGEDMAKAIAGNRCGDLKAKLRMARDIATALEHVHSKGIVHRDVKPANIFLDPSGRIKLMDFGISRCEGRQSTQTALMGTPDYMCPEQIRGEPVSQSFDIYSYGVLLYELFTGVKPFSGNTAELLYKVVEQEIPLEPLWQEGLPWPLIDLIRRATAKDRDDRPDGFGRIGEQLDKILAGKSRNGRLVFWAGQLGRKAKDAVAAGVVIVALGVGVVWTAARWVDSPQPGGPASQPEVRPRKEWSAEPPTAGEKAPERRDEQERSPIRLGREKSIATPAMVVPAAPVAQTVPASAVETAGSVETRPEAALQEVPVRPDTQAGGRASASVLVEAPRATDPASPAVTDNSPSPVEGDRREAANRTVRGGPSASRAADREQIFSTIEQLVAAFQRKDLRQIANLWPTVTPAQLRAFHHWFSGSKVFHFQVEPQGDPEFPAASGGEGPVSAKVRCTRHVSMVPRSGPTPEPRSDGIVVYFERRKGEWRMVGW